jgi:hypothetical protein
MNENIIGAVVETFIVICGVAVTQFFSGGTVVDTDPAFWISDTDQKPRRDTWYVACYILALIVIVTLVLRFLIGSHEQLSREYSGQATIPSFHRFVTDISFLMFFGAFLVGAAQAKSVRAFMGWLALTSAVGVLWSFIALGRGDSNSPYWWLMVNFGQFLLTGSLALCCKPVDAKAGQGKTPARSSLVIAGIWFMLFFVFDLEKILLGKLVF